MRYVGESSSGDGKLLMRAFGALETGKDSVSRCSSAAVNLDSVKADFFCGHGL